MLAFVLCIIFYCIGAFPSGYLIGRLHGITIWQHGSGNIGATNVSRVLGKKAGVLTLAADVLKGAAPIFLLSSFGFVAHNEGCLGMFLVLGHCLSFPPLLKGGKGVATALGVFLAFSPLLALFAITIFASTLVLSRIVSLSSIIAAALVPVFAMICYSDFYQPYIPWLMIISLVVVGRHHANLQRLILGQEPQFSFNRKNEEKSE